MSNEHFNEAVTVGQYYATRTLDSDADVIAMGQVNATLALAYEQRTANLIAALQPVRLIGGKEWLPTEGTVDRVRAEIDARLYPKPAL